MLVVGKGIGRLFAKIKVDSPDGHVHGSQPPGGGVALLPVNGDVPDLAAVFFNKTLALDKEAPGPHGRVINLALVRLQHLDNE